VLVWESTPTDMRLTTNRHDRDSAGLLYVYPVVSRRAGGLSVGINLNPNNACNWRCIYCQVPGLVYGMAPTIDLPRLEAELRGFMDDLLRGDYMSKHVPEGSRVLKDVAFSGNGEPTSSKQFAEAVDIVGRALEAFDLLGKIQLVLITNGSLVHQPHVQRGLAAMKELGGVVWFKLDSATDAGQAHLNGAKLGVERVRANLEIAARACPTWIQTIMLGWSRDGATHAGGLPTPTETEAYLEFLRDLVRREVPVRGVLLYGLARTSHQPEASELSPLPREWMASFAARIESTGLGVRLCE
jgi:wyosine [tRNA(Phe)-imidazoG37] synthetase (radical SAM superfamily)